MTDTQYQNITDETAETVLRSAREYAESLEESGYDIDLSELQDTVHMYLVKASEHPDCYNSVNADPVAFGKQIIREESDFAGIEIPSEDFNIGQIVNGSVAGRFVILGFRVIDGERYAQLKPVGPNDELGKGEIALPIDALKS